MPSLKEMKNRGLTKDQIVDYRLQSRYGITLKQKHAIFDEQEGCCAVCGKHATELKSPLCVDHCHSTGQIRGLLCYGCNTGLSYYEKHKEAYEEYLLKYVGDI